MLLFLFKFGGLGNCPPVSLLSDGPDSSSFGSSNLLNAAENWIDAEIYEWHAKRNTSWNINHLLCHVAAVVLDQFICKLVCRPSLIQLHNRLKWFLNKHFLHSMFFRNVLMKFGETFKKNNLHWWSSKHSLLFGDFKIHMTKYFQVTNLYSPYDITRIDFIARKTLDIMILKKLM